MDYSNLSYQLTKTISKADKKNNGIYFTPPDTIQRNIDILSPYMDNIQNVLEPACGSCEYISALNNNNNNLNITGIEFNKTIYESIKDLESDNITLLNHDFLAYDSPTKYDLIIGNPPYFVLKKNDVDEEYYSYFNGRPNIFILFIIKSLKLLNTNGILSFVLPTGFFNSVYYDKTRHYIADNFKIINIIECNDNYIETQQGTIILIVQKTINESHYINENNKNFILRKNNYTIFGTPDNIKKLKKLYINSKTLHDLNFDVNVGTVVWNQCKSILTDDESKTRLIYSSDISNNQLCSLYPDCLEGNLGGQDCVDCPDSIEGDVDGDGEVTILDIVLIVNCILSNDCDECSDWNYDGSVDILDIILMINIILEP